jgi:hypothetical protein
MMAGGTDRATAPPVNVVRYGREEALPKRRVLRAGPVTAVLEGGDLRYVRLGEEETVRRVYGAVRDQNWNTVTPRFTRYEVEAGERAFAVRFTAEHVEGAVDFVWYGEFVGTEEGQITCSFEGRARSAFERNRIGWCVLHPMALSGLAATVETPAGETVGAFPERIAPHQPFFEMRAIRHRTGGGGEVVIRFEGDLFEMEDQRNWTDASYKTYSTPLRIPYPVAVAVGDRVSQTVTIAARPGASFVPVAADEHPLAVTVSDDHVGTLPPIGFGAARRDGPLPERERSLLAALRPAHLRVVVDPSDEQWGDRLAAAASDAVALGAALEVEAVVDGDGAGLGEVCLRLGALAAPLARLLVFERGSGVTTEAVIAAARRAAEESGLRAPVGGGSRAYFTQLNRATLPLDRMEVVTYGINPQVHAFDNASLVETLAAQGVTVGSARAIAGDRPLAVGPITLRPRFNPDATGPAPAPAPGTLPPSVDPRQSSLFAAGWTVGSVRSLATAGVETLTYYETTGWRGLVERSDHPLRVPGFHSSPGMAFPVYHVFADLAEFAGAQVLGVEGGDRLRIDALAMRAGDRFRLLVASFEEAAAEVRLALPGLAEAGIRQLDEETYALATREPERFRRERAPLGLPGGETTVVLKPFAVATIDGRVV